MPRPTLAKNLKHLRSYEVLVTQTTEDDLWTHFCTKFENFEDRAYSIMKLQEDYIKQFRYNNPYMGKSWRNKAPERIGTDKTDWLGDENTVERYFSLMSLINDLYMCDEEFNWSTDTEFSAKYCDFLYEAQKVRDIIRSEQDDLEILEKLRYNQAKKEWEEYDKIWIAENKLIEAHRKHKPNSYWLHEYQNNQSYRDWLQVRECDIPNEEECKFCIRDKQFREETQSECDARQRMEEQQREEKERLRQEEILNRPVREVKTYTCELCDIQTHSKLAFDTHLETRDHKKRERENKLYCSCCKVQSRCEREHQDHLSTLKHKKMNGEEEETKPKKVWKCIVCDYEANTKQNYDKHCLTSKHIENMKV